MRNRRELQVPHNRSIRSGWTAHEADHNCLARCFLLLLLTASSLVLMTSCGTCKHEWLPGTCTEASRCTICGEVKGNPLGHAWKDATYTEQQTCERCGLQEGSPLASPYANCGSWEEVFEIIFQDAFTIPFTMPYREAIALQFDSVADMKEFMAQAETAVEVIAKPERFGLSIDGCKGIFLIVDDIGMITALKTHDDKGDFLTPQDCVSTQYESEDTKQGREMRKLYKKVFSSYDIG